MEETERGSMPVPPQELFQHFLSDSWHSFWRQGHERVRARASAHSTEESGTCRRMLFLLLSVPVRTIVLAAAPAYRTQRGGPKPGGAGMSVWCWATGNAGFLFLCPFFLFCGYPVLDELIAWEASWLLASQSPSVPSWFGASSEKPHLLPKTAHT